MKLRDYQTDIVNGIRQAFSDGHKSVAVQLVTGAGKTAIFTEILSSLNRNGKTAWVIVPRLELLSQASEHLHKWGTPHNLISADSQESNAFKIHVVSRDSLSRRYARIKNKPDYIIFDECHIALNRQIEISEKYPDAKVIGFSATIERADGRGLSRKSGGLYDVMVKGPEIPDLTSRGFISKIRYFCPPISGLDELHRKGTDYVESELDEFLKKKRIYGDAIEHYRKYTDKKPALVFCRSVKSAYETAERFRQAGYEAYCIEGKQSDKERKLLLDGLRTGKIHILTACDLIIYGLNVENVEVVLLLRPTTSKAVYCQSIGRGLRPFDGKECLTVMDFVGNLYEHQEPHAPGVPLHYLDKIDWNFHGTEKRKRVKTDERLTTLRLCSNCYMYFEGNICPNCGTACGTKQREELKKIEAELTEIEPVALSDRSPEEKKEYIDRIESSVSRYSSIKDCQSVTDMIKIADELGNQPMWIYHKLNGEGRKSVNVSLLEEISRQKGFKRGWSWVQREKLKGRM